MRIKTLLIAGAALASGVISSQAQVYSQNIVGYVNFNLASGFTTLNTPLDVVSPDLLNTNNATNILANPYNGTIGDGPLDASQLYVWTGTTYKVYLFDANTADATALGQTFTGITDVNGNFVTPPTLGNGVGYYLKYSQISGFPAIDTNTVVGSVRGVNSGNITNTVAITANPVIGLVGSGLPIGGGLLTDLQLTNLLSQGVLDGDQIQIPKLNGAGNLTGYTVYLFDSNPGDATALGQTFTGITDANGNFVTQPILPVGASFLFSNPNGTPLSWTQVLNIQ